MDSCETKCNHKRQIQLHSHSHSHNHCHNHTHNNDSKHSHDHGIKRKKFLGCCFCSDIMRLSFMIAMVFSFFLVELIVGYVTRSIALTNDAFHMLSDGLSLFIALGTAIIARRHKSEIKKRTEVLGSLINSVFLISLCFSILIEAIERLFDPKEIKDIDLLLYVGIVGLAINLVGLFLFGHAHTHTHGHSHSKPGSDEDEEDLGLIQQIKVVSEATKSDFILSVKELNHLKDKTDENDTADQNLIEYNKASTFGSSDSLSTLKKKTTQCHILSSEANTNMRAAFLHVMADALGSVIVIISALINKFQKELHVPKAIIDLIDPILCLCLVTLILCSAIPLAKETSLFLLKSVPNEDDSTCTKKESCSSIINSSSCFKDFKTPDRRHSMF